MKHAKLLITLTICCLMFIISSCDKKEEGNTLDKISQYYYIGYNESLRTLHTYATFKQPNDIPILLVSPAYVSMNGFSLTEDSTGPTYSLKVLNTGLASNYQWEYNDEENRIYKNEINFNGRTISFISLPDSVDRVTPVNISWNGVVQNNEKVTLSVSKKDSLIFLMEQNVVGATNLQVIFSPSVVDTSIKKIYLGLSRQYKTDLQQKTPNGGGEIKLEYSSKIDSIYLKN